MHLFYMRHGTVYVQMWLYLWTLVFMIWSKVYMLRQAVCVVVGNASLVDWKYQVHIHYCICCWIASRSFKLSRSIDLSLVGGLSYTFLHGYHGSGLHCVAVPQVVHEVYLLIWTCGCRSDSCEQGVNTQFDILVEDTRWQSDSTSCDILVEVFIVTVSCISWLWKTSF